MGNQGTFDPSVPYEDLPLLPPPREEYENADLLRAEARARAAVTELKGYANIIPNQAVLVNALGLREAQDSSEIENIITTQDELYRAETLTSQRSVDPAAKEVLRYREALWYGYRRVTERGMLTIPDIIKLQSIIEENDAGIRRTPGTALVNDATKETVFTPPQDEQAIKRLLDNLADYLNDTQDDSLIKSAIIHYQFETIHPFYDGNGRTGRIINVLYLILKGYLDIPILYVSSYIIEHKGDYYRLLLEVSRTRDWNGWISFYLAALERTARRAIETVGEIKKQMDETIDYVRTHASRIYTKELVEALYEHPYCKNEFIERVTGVERKAASRYLHELEQIGVLTKRKVGRENLFINTNLMKLLQSRK